MADLIADLWDASFNGVPFYVEKDDLEDGRRLVIHSFPLVDEPFIEDLGRKVRRYSVEGYLVGDDYVSAASAFGEALAALPGAGTLVLPTEGPFTARCHTYRRGRGKERIGFISVHIEFIREGLSTAFVSVDFLAQLAFDANASLSASLAAFTGQLALVRQPGWIADATTQGLQDIVARLDTIRVENTVDPVLSYGIGLTFLSLYNAAPAAVSPITGLDVTFLPRVVAAARALAAAMPAATAVAAFGQAAEAVPQPPALLASPGVSNNRATVAINAGVLARAARAVLLSAYVDATINSTFASRPEGVTARGRLVEYLNVELGLCTGALNADLYVALQGVRNACVAYLSNLVATLAPVVTVTSNIALPSLVLAWKLYGDPTRAPELVARNDVRHPSYMPERIEALAPSAV